MGEVITIAKDYPPDPNAPTAEGAIITSADDVPVVGEADVARWESDGASVYDADPVIGDPTSLDNTDTLVKTYDDIQINTLDDTLFRLPFFAEAAGGAQ